MGRSVEFTKEATAYATRTEYYAAWKVSSLISQMKKKLPSRLHNKKKHYLYSIKLQVIAYFLLSFRYAVP